MQRVLIVGSGGAGKSTLSKRLGTALGLPVIHLDSLYWSPGWIEPDKLQWAATVRKVVSQPAWILPDMPAGCLERLDLGFMLWIWRYPNRTRRKVLELLGTHRATKNVVHLRTRADVERFIHAPTAR